MQKKGEVSKKVIENTVRYAVYFLLVVITPLLAQPVAKLFDWCTLDWAEKGQLREFFHELFTCAFWGIEFLALYFVNRRMKSEGGKRNSSITKIENQDLEIQAEVAVADGEKKAEKPLLPMRNIIFLFLISAACVLLISTQIDFQVKPFYDIGKKISTSGIMIKASVIVRNVVKCVWITMLLKSAYTLMEGVLETFKKKKSDWLIWLGVAFLVFCFGIYDVVASKNPFAWTYLLFYLAFTAVYYFAERNDRKSFLLIFFIYIF